MARFCDLGIDSDVIVGKKIEMEELFDKRIVIEKFKISPSKYPGKNSSGLRMQMQIVLASFNDKADSKGDYYVKDERGKPKGEIRCVFTGSDILIDAMKKVEEMQKLPLDTTIVKIGKCFKFQ